MIRILGFTTSPLKLLTDRNLRSNIADSIDQEMKETGATCYGMLTQSDAKRILEDSSRQTPLAKAIRTGRVAKDVWVEGYRRARHLSKYCRIASDCLLFFCGRGLRWYGVMQKAVVGFVIVALLVAGGYFFYQAQGKNSLKRSPVGQKFVIGLSLGTLKEERWPKDRDFIVKKVEELGGSVNVLSADADKDIQKAQIESLILQNVPVIIVVPQDDKVIAPLVEKAHQKGIKIIAYDRLIQNSPVDAYITVDYVKAGEQQASAVLQKAGGGNFAIVMGDKADSTVAMQKQGILNILKPEITKGKVKVVYDDFTQDWKPEVAYQHIKTLLLSTPVLDGVVSMNDGMAGGIVKALRERNLAGKVPVSGMDAELAGTQRVVEGVQTETSYLPIYLEAYRAAEVAVALAKGQVVPPDTKTDNGMIGVPTYLVQPVSITKDNMQTVIKDGFHTYEEIYQNIAPDKRPPR